MTHRVFSAIFCIVWNIKSHSTLSFSKRSWEYPAIPTTHIYKYFLQSHTSPQAFFSNESIPLASLLWKSDFKSLFCQILTRCCPTWDLVTSPQHHKNGCTVFRLSQSLNQLLSLFSWQKPYSGLISAWNLAHFTCLWCNSLLSGCVWDTPNICYSSSYIWQLQNCLWEFSFWLFFWS